MRGTGQCIKTGLSLACQSRLEAGAKALGLARSHLGCPAGVRGESGAGREAAAPREPWGLQPGASS